MQEEVYLIIHKKIYIYNILRYDKMHICISSDAAYNWHSYHSWLLVLKDNFWPVLIRAASDQDRIFSPDLQMVPFLTVN